MRAFQSVLVYLPRGADSAVLTTAARLSRHREVRLEILDVVSDQPKMMSRILALPAPEDLLDLALEERREILSSRIQDLQAEGYRVSGEVRVGRPFVEIVRAVQRSGHEVVVIGPERQRGAYAGTTLRVLRSAPCPVWVSQPGVVRRPRRILATIDPGADQSPQAELDRRVLQLATTLASTGGAELHVLHVWNAAGLPVASSARVWDQWQRATQSELVRRIEGLLAPYEETLDIHVHLMEGEPAEAIVVFARQSEVDLTILGTVSRTGVAGFLIGNTAEEVLQEIECAVLAVKPESFESPVAPHDADDR